MTERDFITADIGLRNTPPGFSGIRVERADLSQSQKGFDNPVEKRILYTQPVTLSKLAKDIHIGLNTLVRRVNEDSIEVKREGKLISEESANEISRRFSNKPRSTTADWRGLEDEIEETVTLAQIKKNSGVDPHTLTAIVRDYEEKTGFVIRPVAKRRYRVDDAILIQDLVVEWLEKNVIPFKVISNEPGIQSFTTKRRRKLIEDAAD